jgi:hypothetical protein
VGNPRYLSRFGGQSWRQRNWRFCRNLKPWLDRIGRLDFRWRESKRRRQRLWFAKCSSVEQAAPAVTRARARVTSW